MGTQNIRIFQNIPLMKLLIQKTAICTCTTKNGYKHRQRWNIFMDDLTAKARSLELIGSSNLRFLTECYQLSAVQVNMILHSPIGFHKLMALAVKLSIKKFHLCLHLLTFSHQDLSLSLHNLKTAYQLFFLPIESKLLFSMHLLGCVPLRCTLCHGSSN